MNRFAGVGISVLLLFTYGCAILQPSQPESNEEIVVGKIGNQAVTLDELMSHFNKSGTNTRVDIQELEDFLELYMNFRLKLAVAEDAGYLEDPEILAELKEYEIQSAYPFWLERHVKNKLLDELYERSGEQIHAQHILIEIPDNASPSDTASAWNRLMEAREKFINGESDFMSLVQTYSSQRRGQSMGGDLGYFSAGWAVKPFEDAAYSLSKGEVSKPFQSPFGYHIVYVKDRIETGPEKHFSHIFFMTRGIPDPVDSVLAKAQSAYDKLEAGEPWDVVVENYSEDEQSRLNGGNIGWVGYGMYDQTFTETLMTIEEKGDFTNPFISSYGVHIVRLDSLRYPSEEQLRSELAEQLRQLPRFRENERAVLDNAAEAGNARFHRDNLSAFEDFVRKNYRGDFSGIDVPDSILESRIFTFHNKSWTGAEYLEWLTPVVKQKTNPQYHHSLANEFRDYAVDARLTDLTRERFPEFQDLSRDYLAGLAVFKVNEDSLWNYAQNDTLRLREIFEANPGNYQNEKRYRFIRFSAGTDSTLDQVREKVQNGVPLDSIRSDFSNVLIRRDVVSQIDTPPFNHLRDLGEREFSPYFEYQRRQTTLYLEEILEAGPMTFEEAVNKLVTDYQSIREKEWIRKMRDMYSVEIYPEVLRPSIAESNE